MKNMQKCDKLEGQFCLNHKQIDDGKYDVMIKNDDWMVADGNGI